MLSWTWNVFLTWFCGRFTPRPIAVRVGPVPHHQERPAEDVAEVLEGADDVRTVHRANDVAGGDPGRRDGNDA